MEQIEKRIDWLLGATIGVCVTMLVLLGIGLGAVVLAIPSLFVFQGNIVAQIAKKYPAFSPAELPWLLAILIAVALILVLSFLFIRTLLDIVTSVGTGDPLTTENAARLEKMAWLAIGVEGVGLAMVGMTWWMSSVLREFDWDFDVDLSTVVLVLLLFVLARVFRTGAAMRAELEGTV